MKSYLHILVVLAINAKTADANFHYTECDMTKVLQNVIWILTIKMSHNHTRYGFKNMQKVSCSDKRAMFVCLFDLILYVPSTIFQLNRDGSSWVEPVLS